MGVGASGREAVAGDIERAGGREQKTQTVEANSAPVVDTAGPSILLPKIDIMNPLKESAEKALNTKNLTQRLVVDAGCAASAGALVAPVVSMIDR